MYIIYSSACRLKSHYENWAYLSHEDLEALIESGDIQLIDIREEKEIEEQGEFPGAINIPCRFAVLLIKSRNPWL